MSLHQTAEIPEQTNDKAVLDTIAFEHDTELFSDPTTPDKEATDLLTGNSDWQITAKGFDPTSEHSSVEALLTLANGYAGTRASLEEGHPACRSGTFLAGVFDPILKFPEPSAELNKAPRLIRGPDWINLGIESIINL